MAKKTAKTQKFSLYMNMFETEEPKEDWFHRFNFDAKNLKKANEMATDWARYHSIRIDHVEARPVDEDKPEAQYPSEKFMKLFA